jgi:hypothetical protein
MISKGLEVKTPSTEDDRLNYALRDVLFNCIVVHGFHNFENNRLLLGHVCLSMIFLGIFLKDPLVKTIF